VVVRDAAALRAAVADRGGALVVELDPAGGVFALGKEPLAIRCPVRLVSGAGGGATLSGGEGGGFALVRVHSPGVALEGLAVVAGTNGEQRDQQSYAVWVDKGGEAELRGCDVTGEVFVHGTAALCDCAVHDITYHAQPGVYVTAKRGAGRATLERCAIERCVGSGVEAINGGVMRLVETTVRECSKDDYCTRSGGVIEGVAPGLITKR
jgi:nitrous oxidase accessory protein NosD